MSELAQVQSWLQGAILSGGAHEPDALVAGDERLDAAGRVGIYAGGYRARLIDCLRGEYPALRRFAGDTAFDLFASAYIATTPSRDPSLYAFGLGFADFLERNAPPEAAAGSPLAIPAQLARLERARGEAGRAPGVEGVRLPLTADDALLPGVRLRVPEAVRLLRLDFDFTGLIAAIDRDETAPDPPAVATLTVVARSAWRVRLHRLNPWRFAFLEALLAGSGDVHEAAAASAREAGRDLGRTLADLALWLPAAGQLGLAARA